MCASSQLDVLFMVSSCPKRAASVAIFGSRVAGRNFVSRLAIPGFLWEVISGLSGALVLVLGPRFAPASGLVSVADLVPGHCVYGMLGAPGLSRAGNSAANQPITYKSIRGG